MNQFIANFSLHIYDDNYKILYALQNRDFYMWDHIIRTKNYGPIINYLIDKDYVKVDYTKIFNIQDVMNNTELFHKTLFESTKITFFGVFAMYLFTRAKRSL